MIPEPTNEYNAAFSTHCGHDPAQFVIADEGTSYCPACESDATAAASTSTEIMIRLWPFDNAPQKYRDLSPHGGDEDWIMFVPDELRFDTYRLESAIGIFDTSEHKIDGATIFIGAHS